MNESKKRNPYHWLKLRASGAVRTVGKHDGYDAFMAASARAELRGEHMMAGILRVEAHNDRSNLQYVEPVPVGKVRKV